MLTRENDERRNFLRLQIEGDVVCRLRDTNRAFRASAMDLSHTGLKFKTTELLNEGALVDVSVKVGNRVVPPLQALFLVRRVQRDGDIYVVAGEMSHVK